MGTLRQPAAAAVATGPAPAQPVLQPRPAPPKPKPDPAELDRLREAARTAGLAQGREQGFAEGHAQGHAAGLAAGEAELREQAAQLQALAGALPGALQAAHDEVAQAVVALALDIARQVVHRSLETKPELLLPLVRELLHREPALQGDPRLLLHPLDAELVNRQLGSELDAAGWQVRPDDTVSRGGCLVQASSGTCDASLETRWARVQAALAGMPAV